MRSLSCHCLRPGMKSFFSCFGAFADSFLWMFLLLFARLSVLTIVAISVSLLASRPIVARFFRATESVFERRAASSLSQFPSLRRLTFYCASFCFMILAIFHSFAIPRRAERFPRIRSDRATMLRTAIWRNGNTMSTTSRYDYVAHCVLAGRHALFMFSCCRRWLRLDALNICNDIFFLLLDLNISFFPLHYYLRTAIAIHKSAGRSQTQCEAFASLTPHPRHHAESSSFSTTKTSLAAS